MKTITTTEDLAAFCANAKTQPYVTIDTEFLRERTYYSKLCLVQMALPGKNGDAVLVDPLADGISLEPLYDLFRHEATVKVFHAARQDLEIFFVEGNVFPKPMFDTQVAAMVCGFGEQVGYETLVKKIAREGLDKSSRFTDWSRRPLSEAQRTYALADVTHLRVIYEYLSAELARSGRQKWVEEEIRLLVDPETYINRPEDVWEKVKTRTTSGRFLAVVRELARFREDYAQTRDVPRSRVFKDDALLELASTRPTSSEELGRSVPAVVRGGADDSSDSTLCGVNTPDTFERQEARAINYTVVRFRPHPGSRGTCGVPRRHVVRDTNAACFQWLKTRTEDETGRPIRGVLLEAQMADVT